MATLGIDEFVDELERAGSIVIPRPAETAIFGIDFDITSMQVLDILMELESLGAELPPDVLFSVQTVEDLYREYTAAAGHV